MKMVNSPRSLEGGREASMWAVGLLMHKRACIDAGALL